MKRWKYTAIMVSIIVLRSQAFEDRFALTLGPTFHYKFGQSKRKWSAGFEVSFWVEQDQDNEMDHSNFLDDLLPCPYGVDLGFELGNKLFRVYSEAEIGLFVAGLGVGPVIELDWKENIQKIGGQGTLWAAAFGGLDARYQYFKDSPAISAGTFLKFPIPFYPLNYM